MIVAMVMMEAIMVVVGSVRVMVVFSVVVVTPIVTLVGRVSYW